MTVQPNQNFDLSYNERPEIIVKAEGKTFERYKKRVSLGEKQRQIGSVRQHIIDFRDFALNFGLGSFELQLYRLVNH